MEILVDGDIITKHEKSPQNSWDDQANTLTWCDKVTQKKDTKNISILAIKQEIQNQFVPFCIGKFEYKPQRVRIHPGIIVNPLFEGDSKDHVYVHESYLSSKPEKETKYTHSVFIMKLIMIKVNSNKLTYNTAGYCLHRSRTVRSCSSACLALTRCRCPAAGGRAARCCPLAPPLTCTALPCGRSTRSARPIII